jgi:hypothetical protein
MLCCLGGECDGTSSLSRKASKFSPPFVTNETDRRPSHWASKSQWRDWIVPTSQQK